MSHRLTLRFPFLQSLPVMAWVYPWPPPCFNAPTNNTKKNINMHTDTLSLEQDLLLYLQDDQLSKTESRELKAALMGLPNEDINFLRNRLFELARDRLSAGSPDAMSIIGWLDRCTKAIDGVFCNRQSRHEAHFTPGDACLDHIIAGLNNARSRIEICVFTISDNRLSDAIANAFKRGIAVRIISDNHKQHDAGSDLEWLIEQGIPTRFDRTPDHMHHKFCVVDGLTLINGSFNWTRSATERNQENIVISQDSALVLQFQQQFDALWEAYS